MTNDCTERFAWSAPDVISAGGAIRSWIITPPGMLNVVDPGTFVTGAMARFITVDVEAEMKRRCPDAVKFIYVHDFSGVAGYEPDARRILTSWGLSRIGEVERVVIVTSRSQPLTRMAISTAEAVLRVAGMNIEVVDDLQDTVAQHGITRATR